MGARTALVTGATGGMGRIIATELARSGTTVVAVARTAEAGERLRQQIAGTVEVEVADLAVQGQVRRLADRVAERHGELNLLVNNAGAHFRERRLSPDGVEMHLAVDHLAGFALTTRLLGGLEAGARRLGVPSRVVNVVSATMADTRQVKIRRRPRPVALDPADLDDPQRLNGPHGFVAFEAYARAKLLTVMTGYLLAARADPAEVTVNAVHPGLVATPIVDDIMSPWMRPLRGLVTRGLLDPAQGAAPVLRLAGAAELDGVTGRYFDRDVESRSPEVSYDGDLQRRAWRASEALLSGSGVR
jgi:NAD(P)-dependent dehydrogenase (short-subunit alcohol dehydrogenase family)